MATAQLSISGNGDDKRTLVVVFLRGAADGLTLVAPLADDGYYRYRPRLAVKQNDAVPLDGFFGMHPNLRPLETAWKDGDLAIIHGAGAEDESRSHFDAQDFMEHGGLVPGGWLGRYLRSRGPSRSPLGAVALSPTLPECLSGAPTATAFQSLKEFAIRHEKKPQFSIELQSLYSLETGALHDASTNTFDAIRRVEAIPTNAPPANGTSYNERDEFAQGLRQVAQLIRADIGMEAATVDIGGWDSHFVQQTTIEPLMTRLASGLAAFRQDLGARMATTTVVVMTEFGRRVAENSAFGTDHGRGSMAFVLGGGVRGGRVFGSPHTPGGGTWPGLTPEMLDGPGDLPVWNNYRNILASVLARHGAGDEALTKVFPGFALKPLPLYA